MEEERLVVRPLVAHLDDELLATVRARRLVPGSAGSTRSGRWRLASTSSPSTRFVGPGTDLPVGLLPSSRFAKDGGGATTRTGIQHVPNLPTEELFTTPDPARTEVVVTSTKPLDVNGSILSGLRSTRPLRATWLSATPTRARPRIPRTCSGSTRARSHVDFMIGSDEVAVSGVTRDGDEMPLLGGGAWQI